MNLWTRFIIIMVVLLIAGVAAYPPGESIKLGLDLQGGMHLVLRVKTDDAINAEVNKDIERLEQELIDENIRGANVERQAETSFVVYGVDRDQDDKVDDIMDQYLQGWEKRRSGEQLNFSMTQENIRTIRDLAVKQALETIRNRIDAFGVAEPMITRVGLGGERIVVQLPGVDDPERIKELIKNTAFLEFRLAARDTGPADSEQQLVDAFFGGQLPDDIEIYPQDLRDEDGNVYAQRFWALETRQVITGRDLKTARPSFGEFNDPVVNFILTSEGGKQFGEVTSTSIGRNLAIVLDGKVMSAPTIQARITDEGIIQGQFTQQEVEDLSTVLRSGALPAGLEYLEERTVGPSLGQDSIDRGWKAGVLGGILVIFTMLIVYKISGINAVVALSLNIVFVFGALATLGATLTVPGIAGIVLTIGMAVDANVLVFERIREELRAGRTVKSAIVSGFEKALSSVLDANITTLIAAMFLFLFGTGPIRGFAVTLSIGILASVFTAIFVSRFFFDSIYGRRQRVEKLSI